MVLAAFVTGAVLGIFFEREDFLGGYSAFRRRIVVLGHIALAALGILNVVYSLSPIPTSQSTAGRIASICFAAGGASMPAVCFLTGWDRRFKILFPLPVVTLIAAVIAVMLGGLS